jgi:dihydrofolate reductase
MGRRTFEMAGDSDSYADTYEYQVPIFVLTHQAPERHPRENAHLKFTFVTDGIESGVRQAKAAAGDKDVTVVGGASTIQGLLRAGLVDELSIDIMPVLPGSGLRLFEQIGKEIMLEKIDVSEIGARTCLRFRVVKEST